MKNSHFINTNVILHKIIGNAGNGKLGHISIQERPLSPVSFQPSFSLERFDVAWNVLFEFLSTQDSLS